MSGTTTMAPMPKTCTAIESGTVYHLRVPTWNEGLTTSPNICGPFGSAAAGLFDRVFASLLLSATLTSSFCRKHGHGFASFDYSSAKARL